MFKFVHEHHLLGVVRQYGLSYLVVQDPADSVAGVFEVVVEHARELLVVQLQQLQGLVLDELCVHSVFSVEELQDVSARVAHRAVVVDHYVFHGLYQAPLDVARLGGLAGRVYNALAPSHCVEEHLLRRQPAEVGVGHEAAALRSVVVLYKVRERSVAKAEGDALALHVLLAYAGYYLGYVYR